MLTHTIEQPPFCHAVFFLQPHLTHPGLTGALQSIRAAFREREDARVTVAALAEDHEEKKRRVAQLEEQSSKASQCSPAHASYYLLCNV